MRRAFLGLALAGALISTSASSQSGVYEGRIDGEFHGWDGDTIYKLADGHIIQQASYYYHYHYAYSPQVMIYQGQGGQKIHVEGSGGNDVSIRVLK